MVEFSLFVDEHGTIGSASDHQGYGYGYLLIEHGEGLDELRTGLQQEFPEGAHFKNFRGARRKKNNAQKMVGCLPGEETRFFGGTFVCDDPEYGRSHYFNALSGVIGNSDTPSKQLVESIKRAEAPAGSVIVDPSDVEPGAKDVGRLLAVYSHVIRVPVVALLKLLDEDEDDVLLHVHLGVVGRPEKYDKQIRKIGPVLAANWESSFRGFVLAGIVAPRRFRLVLETTTAGADPVFDVADLMAHLGYHCVAGSLEDPETTAHALYDATKFILDRVPWSPEKGSIAHGVTRYPPDPADA